MRVSSFIAWRYLWTKKSHSAIQVVSGVSAAAVAVVTAAMICVLSVMNGFGVVLEQMFSRFDADLRIVPVEGKVFTTDNDLFNAVRNFPYIAVFSETIEETALVEYADKQIPALLKGVDENFRTLSKIDSTIIDGEYSVWDGAFDRVVMGYGLSAQLGVGARFVKPVHVYAPKRNGSVNLLRPDDSFRQATCFMSGVFAVNQAKYDERVMLVSLPLMERLFDYQSHQVSAVELRLADNAPRKAQKQIQQIVGDRYRVLNRYEQQEDFFRILRVEKLLTALLLAFIVLIAAFNMVGSLTMLMLDKQADIVSLHHLGASEKQIRRIFLYEGWLISVLGAVAGLLSGVAVCWSQQTFGWLKLGNGVDYVISAYPVSLQATDVLIVAAIVIAIGFVAAWYPTRNMKITSQEV
ncbi:MAG: ABC transporter permease [Paludibacteraceae bacterium]|nr:ABC transporter permease [Paludibacteraceae bacterium]